MEDAVASSFSPDPARLAVRFAIRAAIVGCYLASLALDLGALSVAWIGLACGALIAVYAYAFVRFPTWLPLVIDVLSFVLVLRVTGGVDSLLVPFAYVWLFGVIFLHLKEKRQVPLMVLASVMVIGMAVGSWGGERWGAFMLVQSVAVATTLLLGVALQRERRESRTDPLTRVMHRGAGIKQLEAWVGAGKPFVLAFLDCRNFKDINDSYGHRVGDEVIAAVAGRIAAAVRWDDVVMRYGGDEFVVASRGPALGSRLQTCLDQPVRTSAGRLNILVDVGEVRWLPGETLDDLLSAADSAMYQQKRCRQAQRAAKVSRSR